MLLFLLIPAWVQKIGHIWKKKGFTIITSDYLVSRDSKVNSYYMDISLIALVYPDFTCVFTVSDEILEMWHSCGDWELP